MNVAVVALEPTVTEAGTEAIDGLELLRLMTSPAGAATPEIVTVPVEVDWNPPTTVAGAKLTD